ncbi:hypothetical protein [Pseudomonas putida]|uniref:hypothetical protein n=1 Tax=Pseudomonas putida TaxID=303 RepID=UPI0035BC4811
MGPQLTVVSLASSSMAARLRSLRPFAVGAHHAGLAPEGNREHSIGHQVSALNVGFMEHLHWKEMEDAQQTQARLRDRLATSDLRLSVLVDAGAFAASGCDSGVREATGTGSVVHGAVRAQLDQAHSRRIIAITDEGDRGLIALRACQAYIRESRF